MVPSPEVDGKHVVLLSSIISYQSSRFLIHLILSMGRYVTELDVFEGAGTLKQSFNRVEFDTRHPDGCVRHVLRRFVVEQAQYIPGSTRSFDRNVLRCYKILKNLVEDLSLPYDEIPRVLHSSIQKNATVTLKEYLFSTRQSLAKALFESRIVLDCPQPESISEATVAEPSNFFARISHECHQSYQCLELQSNCLQSIVNHISRYMSATNNVFETFVCSGQPKYRKVDCVSDRSCFRFV